MAEAYHRHSVIYRLAGLEDDTEMRAALRESPMDSWVTATMEHEPSCFAGKEPGRFIPMTARNAEHPHELAGLYSCRIVPVHVEGQELRACYLGGLRLCGRHRGRLNVLKGGFESIPHLLPEVKKIPLVFTSIAKENRRARRILEAGLEGMPRYRFLEDMETFIVNVHRGRKLGLLERAGLSDVSELTTFYNSVTSLTSLSPVLERKWLESMIRDSAIDFFINRSEGRIKACIAVWDQRAYKQIVVRGYRRPLGALRPLHNLWARVAKRPFLPIVGQRLEQVFLAFRAFDASVADKEVLFILEALAAAREIGADSVMLGVTPSSPRYVEMKRALKPYIYATRIETVDLCSPSPHVSGIVQPEVALL